jgi:hypothetical protein
MKKTTPIIGLRFGRNDSPIRYTITDIKGDTLECQFVTLPSGSSGFCKMSLDYFNKGFANSPHFVDDGVALTQCTYD